MDLLRVETELSKRLAYPYTWGRKQSNAWDAATRFIYKTYRFGTLLDKLKPLSPDLQHYAMNRWYNFWSAKAVEAIFAAHPKVEANKNSYDKLVDFRINDIPFDHKTSIFPKGFNRSFGYAQEHKKELIQWLYDNQSQEGRQHYGHRLFIVLYDGVSHKHWQMKAEIELLKKHVDHYVESFVEEDLIKLNFANDEVLSDLIWVTKGSL